MIIRNFLTRALAKWLKPRIAEHMATHAPDQIIGGEDNPYLVRWKLWDNRRRIGNVYLHHIMRDDDDRACHDHPFASISIILEGPLSEYRLVRGREVKRHFSDGDIVIRTPWAKHRLFLPQDYPALTCFFVGPRVKQWRFFCEGKRFVPWRQFTSGPNGETVGRGCAE